jgi:hypothetical protein
MHSGGQTIMSKLLARLDKIHVSSKILSRLSSPSHKWAASLKPSKSVCIDAHHDPLPYCQVACARRYYQFAESPPRLDCSCADIKMRNVLGSSLAHIRQPPRTFGLEAVTVHCVTLTDKHLHPCRKLHLCIFAFTSHHGWASKYEHKGEQVEEGLYNGVLHISEPERLAKMAHLTPWSWHVSRCKATTTILLERYHGCLHVSSIC